MGNSLQPPPLSSMPPNSSNMSSSTSSSSSTWSNAQASRGVKKSTASGGSTKVVDAFRQKFLAETLAASKGDLLLSTARMVHRHKKDWRVLQVGFIGYDSYEENDNTPANTPVSAATTTVNTPTTSVQSDFDVEMFDQEDAAAEAYTREEEDLNMSNAEIEAELTNGSSCSTTTNGLRPISIPRHLALNSTASSNRTTPATPVNNKVGIEKWREIVQMRNKEVQQISCGGYHILLLMEDGSVWTYGWNALGQLGTNDRVDRLEKPVRIKLPPPLHYNNQIGLSTPSSPSCVIAPAFTTPMTPTSAPPARSNTSSNFLSPTSQDPHPSRPAPGSTNPWIKMEAPEVKIVKVKGGGRHSVLLSEDGRVFTFGCGEDGRLGVGNRFNGADCLIPTEVEAFRNQRAEFVGAGFWHSIVGTASGKVYMFGHGDEGKLGLGHTFSVSVPAEIVELRGKHIKSASGGAWSTILLTTDQRVYTFGSNYWAQLGVTIEEVNRTHKNQPSDACYKPIEVISLRDKQVTEVASGSNFNVCLTATGQVYTFGCSSSGKTGHGTTATVTVPKLLTSLSHVKITTISCGSNHSVLLSSDNRVFTFGWCKYGQLGHGDYTTQETPKEVTRLHGIEVHQVGSGAFFTIVSTKPPKVATPGFIDYAKYKRAFSDVVFI